MTSIRHARRAVHTAVPTGEDTMDSDSTPDFVESPPLESTPADTQFPWAYAGALTAASIVGCVLVVPFTASLLKQMETRELILALMPVIMAIQVVFEIVLSIAMIALGLGLGRSLRLVWPPLDGWDAGPDRAKRLRSALLLATASGIVLGALFVAQAQVMGSAANPKIDIKIPPWWSCLLASIGAGIREEVWLRLGLMTFFVWIITKLARRAPPATGAVWAANVTASLVFGAIHLPQAFAVLGTGAGIVAFVLIGNGVPGLVFGWLYWRKGLIAAMVSHAVFDIVTKVILPLAMG
jgi:hypothetical protein